MIRSHVFCLVLVLVLAAGLGLEGCRRQERPEGTPEEWYQDARSMEEQGLYFKEERENAPLGALEYYQWCLAEGRFDDSITREIRHRIAWYSALKLLLTEEFMSKADYRGAIEAMTGFRDQWPDSPYRALALYYRGLAKEYDIDFQDTAGAIEDYRQFIAENPDHALVPEAWSRIGHCWEFNLDSADYAKAIAVYDRLIETYGPTNEVVRRPDTPELVRMCVERALYNKARILEDYLAETDDAEKARNCYARAVECYGRLTDPVFFGAARFKQAQFVHYRYGCLLAERLGKVDEGLAALEQMAQRWRESPWYGRVQWRMKQIRERTGRPAATPAAPGGDADRRDERDKS